MVICAAHTGRDNAGLSLLGRFAQGHKELYSYRKKQATQLELAVD
jgi:hypothetical protein